jgi:hypothetical protein
MMFSIARLITGFTRPALSSDPYPQGIRSGTFRGRDHDRAPMAVSPLRGIYLGCR